MKVHLCSIVSGFRFSALFCLSVLLLAAACTTQNSSSSEKPIAEKPKIEIPAPRIDLAKPLEISKEPADIERCSKLNQELEESEFSKARWGVIVIGLNDGRIVCGREVQKLFNPASIHKLLTSIVALDKLGPESRIKTSVYSSSTINSGAAEGDMILYGRGAPDLNDESLLQLVKQLKQKGIKAIEGDIIGDESYFKGDKLGDGWTWNAAQWYYGAAASALSINRNQMTVSLQNGKPKADERYVELSGEVKPVEDIEAIGVKRELGTNRVYVWGNGKNLNARIAVNDPALLSAKIFKELLEKNGIAVSGTVKTRDWKSAVKTDSENAPELASINSETLAESVRKMNKDSVNLYAELILRELGKRFGAEAPDENAQVQKLRGDDLAGADVMTKWLKDHNITTDQIAIHDGSGLSRLDFVTPEAIGRALVFAAG
ncbi:MAG: D-alanyl-D-alanine carboxypeptidase/D-alanyl-D-alanine-endopeptidase, partial [Acidobacteria bacterium]|nr:D-alanyl-D-alanine carboxypeptidase/D-alanyl-D-alanine-endopeptidase [Acidobacteriota bacterium]